LQVLQIFVPVYHCQRWKGPLQFQFLQKKNISNSDLDEPLQRLSFFSSDFLVTEELISNIQQTLFHKVRNESLQKAKKEKIINFASLKQGKSNRINEGERRRTWIGSVVQHCSW
jgi:hypothetical protein